MNLCGIGDPSTFVAVALQTEQRFRAKPYLLPYHTSSRTKPGMAVWLDHILFVPHHVENSLRKMFQQCEIWWASPGRQSEAHECE